MRSLIQEALDLIQSAQAAAAKAARSRRQAAEI
jgi:hypothetical protein